MNEMITERIALGDIDNHRADELAKELDRKPSEIEFVRKGFVAEQKGTDDDERSSTELISTSSVDRDNEILLPKGAILEHYKKNPQVLWAHDYHQPPIGRAAWVKRDKGSAGLIAKTIYAATDFAEEIWSLVKGKFLPARSVGFIPIESHEPDEKEIARHPDYAGARRVYDKWELLEYSVVPVPSNRQALQTACSKDLGISIELQAELGLGADLDTAIDKAFEEVEEPVHEINKQALIELQEVGIAPTLLIKHPSRVKRVIFIPSTIKVVSEPKNVLDIRRQVAKVVSDEINRQRGRV